MPVDINKWKETCLDAYLEVSPVKKLGEEAEQPYCCKCLFHRRSGDMVWTDEHTLLPGGVLALDK